MAKETTFKFRLEVEQKARLKRMAAERGVSGSELVLSALGLDGGPPPPPAAVPADRPDPKKEPGAAAMVEVAERIRRKKGKGK